MEKVDLDYLRKQWKDELGYYWGRAQKEIDEFFEMIKDTSCRKAAHLKSKSTEDLLKDFSLNVTRLSDPLFLPEILNLLIQIKKINYDVFPDNWVSGDYDNKAHASYIYNSLIPKISQVADKVINFKISQCNNLYDKPVHPTPEKSFINRDFKDYGLIQYDHHVDLINSIAYHEKFYTILPNLLRTLFENILHDIFKTSLNDRHKTLYFDEDKGRVADFSILIKLLKQLSQFVFKNEIRENITERIIKILEDVRKKGNLSIHEVIRKVTRSDIDEIQDEIDLALESLLASYHQLENIKIIIGPEIVKKIVDKIGLRTVKNNKKIKRQVLKSQEKKATKSIKYEFLKRLIYLLQKYDIVRNNEREEIETTRELCGLSTQLNIIKFNVEVEEGHPDYPILRSMAVYDNNYLFSFEPLDIPNRFVIKNIGEEKSYFSRDYQEHEGIDFSKVEVLNNFIKYLISRLEDLELYPLIEEIEADERIFQKYSKIQRFIKYLFSNDYLNQDSKQVRHDERVISELKWIEQNEKELNDIFTVFRRKDEPSQYDKVLSILNGKYLVQFRRTQPFKSSIKTNDKVVGTSSDKEVKSTLYEIFESIKNHVNDNYKMKL
ncbi:hypothetical protein LCGC14_0923390 [marine sediment metagenome]|uniref:Uncharacterized protein n=1 Tax=marine sediment metagenome TaxID=412755 RepID=A0A0F9PAS5_9ZZZZ